MLKLNWWETEELTGWIPEIVLNEWTGLLIYWVERKDSWTQDAVQSGDANQLCVLSGVFLMAIHKLKHTPAQTLRTIRSHPQTLALRNITLLYVCRIKTGWPSEGPLTRLERKRQVGEWHREEIKTQQNKEEERSGMARWQSPVVPQWIKKELFYKPCLEVSKMLPWFFKIYSILFSDVHV